MSMAGHRHHDEIIIPRQVLWLAAALIVAVMALTGAVRLGWLEPAPSASSLRATAGARVVAERSLSFADGAGGTVVVTDATTGATVAVLGQEGSGFVRGVLRGLARERRMNGMGADQPFRLARWSDGALTLRDSATGRLIELSGFGPDNVAAFARLMEGAR